MLSDKIIRLLNEKGWSKREAARRCGIPYISFVNITLGKRKNIWPDTMQKLADGFGITISELMDAGDDMDVDFETLKRKIKSFDNSERKRLFREMGLGEQEVEIFCLLASKKLDRESLKAFRTMLERMVGSEKA